VTEPTVIYVADFGETKLAVAQLGDRVAMTIECAEGVAAVKLPAEQAVALALSLLSAHLEAVRMLAERMPDELAAVLAANLLAPQVERGLLARAAQAAPAGSTH
jgi:hypothetical protein